jgi:hypothetical protein
MANVMRYAKRGEGDVRLSWDPANKEEVKAAKKAFDDLLKKGYCAWRVDLPVDKRDNTTRITEFDPEAKEIVVLPKMTGG